MQWKVFDLLCSMGENQGDLALRIMQTNSLQAQQRQQEDLRTALSAKQKVNGVSTEEFQHLQRQMAVVANDLERLQGEIDAQAGKVNQVYDDFLDRADIEEEKKLIEDNPSLRVWNTAVPMSVLVVRGLAGVSAIFLSQCLSPLSWTPQL